MKISAEETANIFNIQTRRFSSFNRGIISLEVFYMSEKKESVNERKEGKAQ